MGLAWSIDPQGTVGVLQNAENGLNDALDASKAFDDAVHDIQTSVQSSLVIDAVAGFVQSSLAGRLNGIKNRSSSIISHSAEALFAYYQGDQQAAQNSESAAIAVPDALPSIQAVGPEPAPAGK